MTVLNATTREGSAKPKRLRREGFIPAVLFGKHLDESKLLQLPQRYVEAFLKSNPIGSKLDLFIDGEKHMALLKDVSKTPGLLRLEHLSFMGLTAGEKVTSSTHIFLLNKDMVDGIVLQLQNEISYKALPSDIIDRIEIDISDMKVGDSLTAAELDICKNQALEIITPQDSVIVSVVPRKEYVEPVCEAAEEETDKEGATDES